MKITVESYGIIRSVETDNDDVTLDKLMELIQELLEGMYSSELVKEYFNA